MNQAVQCRSTLALFARQAPVVAARVEESMNEEGMVVPSLLSLPSSLALLSLRCLWASVRACVYAARELDDDEGVPSIAGARELASLSQSAALFLPFTRRH